LAGEEAVLHWRTMPWMKTVPTGRGPSDARQRSAEKEIGARKTLARPEPASAALEQNGAFSIAARRAARPDSYWWKWAALRLRIWPFARRATRPPLAARASISLR